MHIIVILLIVMLMALVIVSWLRLLQQQQTLRRLKQRQLRLKADSLSEMAVNIEQLIPNKQIAKHINDLAITHLQALVTLEQGNKNHLTIRLSQAEAYSELLCKENAQDFHYQRNSDAQIVQAQNHIKEAIALLPQLMDQGRINDKEFASYNNELQWGLLMVSVMSYVAQGEKSKAISDLFTAQAFYRKAQQLLMGSLLNDPRRLPLVKELAQMIDGSRSSLSKELI
jgi:hypothetical protein